MVEKDPASGVYKYQASSPDELALIIGAKEVGYVFIEKSSTSTTIQINQ